MKPLQQYFQIVLFISFVVLTFECGWNPMVWPFKWNLFSSSFTWWCSLFGILKNEICKFRSLIFDFFLLLGWRGKVIRLTRKRLFCCFTCFGQCIGPLETILHNKRFRVVSEQRKTEERLGTGFSVFAAQKWNKNLAWEKSRHFATPPLVSPRIDVWETSAENPCWWRVTTLVWVVLLIGRAAWEIWFDQSEVLPRSG